MNFEYKEDKKKIELLEDEIAKVSTNNSNYDIDILKYKEVVEHNSIFPRIWHKCRRLYANRWKFDYLPFSFWERIRFSVLLHWKHVEKI